MAVAGAARGAFIDAQDANRLHGSIGENEVHRSGGDARGCGVEVSLYRNLPRNIGLDRSGGGRVCDPIRSISGRL